jgi:hypothetical protein
VECGNCGIPFGLPKNLCDARLKDGGSFYCPNGHRISWTESENDRLRKQAETLDAKATRLLAERDRLAAERDHQKARVNGYKGQLAKTKKRAARGVCPVVGCKRHFADVERHIANKHPDFIGGTD